MYEILPELFHSMYMENEPEYYRVCPVCKKKTTFETHDDLTEHVLSEHPAKLTEYSKSLSCMLDNPFRYFNTYEYDGLYCCGVCGKPRISRSEFNRHFLKHKEYFNDIIAWLREHAK